MKALSQIVFIASFLLSDLAGATTLIWTNAASGNWSVAANWSPNQAPSTNDIAIITNAGVTVTLDVSPTVDGIILGTNGAGTVTLLVNGQTLTLDGPLTVNPSGSFILNSGTLIGSSNAILSGAIDWTAGFLKGTLTLATNSSLTLAGGGGNLYVFNCIVTNYGTVVWSSGNPDGGGDSGTLICNYGLWDCQSDYNFNYDFAGTSPVFNNYGTLRKSGGINTSQTLFTYNVVLNQLAGKVDVQQGNLLLEGGGNFTGGTATNNNGVLWFSSGKFNLNGTVTGTNVIQNAGNLVGDNVVNGGLNWQAGYWYGANSVTIATNSTVIMAGGNGNMLIYSCAVTNYGTVVWSSGNPDGGGNPGTLIYNYGLWDCQSDYSFNDDYGSDGTVFNNYGTLRKSGGINASQTLFTSSVMLNQLAGKVDVQQGNLVLEGGGNFTGGTATNNNGVLSFSSGSFNLNGTATGTNVIENAGNLIGNNVVSGGLIWQAGNWSTGTNSVTIGMNSTLVIAGGGANMPIYHCTVTNYGTVTWTNGNPDGGGSPGTLIYNYGLWDCQSDYNFNSDGAGSGTVFNNYGTLLKSGGVNGNSTIFANAVSFINDGTVDARSGEIQFTGSFSNSVCTLSVENGATIQIPQAVVLPGGLVTGSGTVQAPSITSSGVVSPGATNAVLNLAGNYTQMLGGSMQFDIGGTTPGVNHSQVNVTGTAKLSGGVGLRFSPGYSPAVGSSNVVLTAGSVSGHFNFQDHFYLLGQNKRMSASYNPNNVTLTAISAPDPAEPTLTVAVQNQTFAAGWPSEFAGYNLYVKTNLTDSSWTLVRACVKTREYF